MAIEDIRPTREISFFYENSKGEKEEYIIREPSSEELNECDILRSTQWHKCIKRGMPTEEEILELVKNQGRFNAEKYQEELYNLNEKTAITLQKMATAKTLDELNDLYEEAKDRRHDQIKHMNKKSTYTRHCAEVRADHCYNMALMGVCLERRNGDPVFASFDQVENLDIDKTFENVDSHKDVAFINECLSNFLPFIMGFNEGKAKQPEDMIFESVSVKFQVDEDEKEEALTEEVKDNKEAKEEPIQHEEPEVIMPAKEKEEVVEEVDDKNIDTSLPSFDNSDIVDNTTNTEEIEEVKEEPKVHANNKPKMSVAPPQTMSVSPRSSNQHKNPDDDEFIDTTSERGGFRTGDDDIVGDGSGAPGGIIRTKSK